MVRMCMAFVLFAFAYAGLAEESGPAEKVRELRLRGVLDKALVLARNELARGGGGARREVELRLEMARIYDRIGLHQNTRPVVAALEEIEAADSVAQQAGASPWPEIELARAGYYYRADMQKREFVTAIIHARLALELFQKAGDGHGEADAVHLLGLIHMQRGELIQAKEFFNRSLELDRAAGERAFFRGEYERHVGYVEVLADDVLASIHYFERSLSLRREVGAIDASLFAARILAWALVELGRNEEALPHLYYAIAVAEGINSPVGKARAGLVLGSLYEAENNPAAARSAYELTLESAESVGAAPMADRARGALQRLAAGSSEAKGSREKKVRSAVSSFGRAYQAADVVALQALLTKDYVHVNGNSGSVLNRDEWLSWVKSRREELDSGDLIIGAYEIENLSVEFYGDAAMVRSTVVSTGQRKKGKPFASRIRVTNVWVESDGAWRRAAFYDASVE
jgi:tetratricopeptide (TPR) repeat protein